MADLKYHFFLSLLLAVFLLLLAYHLAVLFFPFNIVQQSTVDFLIGGTPLSPHYPEAEQAHLKDVQGVMQGAGIAFTILFLMIILLGVRVRKSPGFFPAILPVLKLSLSFLLLLLLVAALFFPLVFTLFHEVFFPQGNWQFPADSLLIQTFPGDFFVMIGTIIFGGAALLGAVALFVAWLLVRKKETSAKWSRKE